MIGKLKASVSKNTWAEMVETWQLATQSELYRWGHLRFLKVSRHLAERGEIILWRLADHEQERFETVTPEVIQQTERDWRTQEAERKKRARDRTNQWIGAELDGLV